MASTCAAACRTWRSHACGEGLPTARGEACEHLCARVVRGGGIRPDGYVCAAYAQSRAELIECGAGCEATP